ncbi:MAG: hypothetical protein H3C35_02610 [Bacteroidetes bacterium]|nr:hypothetical protein [Bacteroidota bacterium]
MKKATVILFLAVYTLLIVGVNIMVHTCGGETESILAPLSAEDPCGSEDGTMPNDMCCKTEIKSVKISDEQLAASAASCEPLTVSNMLPVLSSTVSIQETAVLFSSPYEIYPPPKLALYISHSVFLI